MGFSRINDDLNVHQSLADEPNIDDNLSAEQLKVKFDEPGNKLKEKFNNFLDELEGVYGASNIGIEALSEVDTSDNNVRSKFIYLLNMMQGISQGAVPDGSITQAKLDINYENALAKKDGLLQSNLNAEKVCNMTANEIQNSIVKVGQYSGISSNEQTIILGFKPKVVFITENGEWRYQSGSSPTFSRLIKVITEYGFTETFSNSNDSYTYTHTLLDNGFKVGRLRGRKTGEVLSSFGLNKTNTNYIYIAFR